jgi:hypothetical protein
MAYPRCCPLCGVDYRFAGQPAVGLERDPHTIGEWVATFGRGGPAALAFEHTGGSPRPRPGRAGRVEGGHPGGAAGGALVESRARRAEPSGRPASRSQSVPPAHVPPGTLVGARRL